MSMAKLALIHQFPNYFHIFKLLNYFTFKMKEFTRYGIQTGSFPYAP